jgi:hypothetical protein
MLGGRSGPYPLVSWEIRGIAEKFQKIKEEGKSRKTNQVTASAGGR